MQNNKLVYIFDPYCCWSYANSKNLYELFRVYQEKMEFRIYPAGIWYGEKRQRVTSRLAETLEYRTIRISEITGALFSGRFYHLLTDRTLTINSEKPSRALVTVNRYWPTLSVEYTLALQKAFFWEAFDFCSESTYEWIAESLGLPVGEFMALFHSRVIRELTSWTFGQATAYSSICPALFYVNRTGKVCPVARGYEPLEIIRKNLENLLH